MSPCIGGDELCPCQDGDACHYKDAADGTKAFPLPEWRGAHWCIAAIGAVAAVVAWVTR